MTIEQKVNMALARAGMSQAELARRLGDSPQNFSQKLKRDRMKQADLEKIAEIVGGRWVARFEFDDGTQI